MTVQPCQILGLGAALLVGSSLAVPSRQVDPPGTAPQGGSAAQKYELLTPQNSAVILIDHQPQMFFGVGSHDRGAIVNNVVGLAQAAKVFKVPTILTTVAAKSFSGPLLPELQAVWPDTKPIDRTSMNSWDDANFRKAVEATGKKKVVIAALWTEVCLSMPALEMMRDGYQVYIVTDASGGTSEEAHHMAIERMTQAGAIPVTWQQVMLEWQRDWARQETYEPILKVVKKHSGAYGLGVLYAKEMFGAQEGGQPADSGAKK